MFEIAVVDEYDETTEEIEEGKLVRAANRSICRGVSYGQSSAQYGRILPGATEAIFRHLGLTRKNVYIDIGAGLYNSVFQAAFTYGCESRGIEIVEERHQIGLRLKKNLKQQLTAINTSRGGPIWKKVGKVTMRCGRLEDPQNLDFLANCNGPKVVKAFANNFYGVFADRSAAGKEIYYLDHYIAGLFAEMKPGSVLITLHMLDLPLSYSDASDRRKLHHLKCDADTSFYEMEKFDIGKANECVSWSAGGSNEHEITVYRYVRLQQKSERAVFMCCNPLCPTAESHPVLATKKYTVSLPTGMEERTVINYCCTVCNTVSMGLRKRASKPAKISDSE